MSWLLNLYETYEANTDLVGKIEKKYNGQEYSLLPISHTTQTAHIEVLVTDNGDFHSARVIEDKNEANTLIPCTEDSANRAGSKIAPYPLHDKLSYVSGDYVKYGGNTKKDEEPFQAYINQLKRWAESPYTTEKIKSIYQYLSKKSLISDLIEHKILHLDENNRLLEKWDSKYGEKPLIFSIVSGSQHSAFVRFSVHSSKKVLAKVWNDPDLYRSFINFYRNMQGDKELCYVTGRYMPVTEKHANKIRNSGDKAKLISANDTSGFTFRGRFKESGEVAGISYEVSQKAHNALKWLINRQGKIVDGRVFLVWGNDELNVPDTTEDSFDILSIITSDGLPKPKISYTNKEFANEFAKALSGYQNDLDTKSNINILIIDSATTGRMGVLYYRSIDKFLYLDRLTKWHSTCVWLHRYRKDENGKTTYFLGAPALKDIAFAAYGSKANEKIVKGLMERMLPCIIDNLKIPTDIVNSAFRRASNPVSMEKWEWEKTLSITCALINRGEGYNVSLDKENTNRDYLFGRLLAIADVLERRAMSSDETRVTNSVRYMNAFSQHPERTWKVIQASLQPYQVRLGTKGLYLSKLMDEVASKIKYEEFNNKSLSGKYLLGFYSQRHDLYQKKEKEEMIDNNEGEN